MSKPIIGILLDSQEQGSFSSYPYYALRRNYFSAITNNNAIAVGIPYTDNYSQYLDIIDGLLSPGGEFAFPKNWYFNSNTPYEYSPRIEFDINIIETALKRDMPILGICAGMQIMAALTGCKLASGIDSRHYAKKEELVHEVSINKNSRLYNIVKKDNIKVNSAHREAVVTVSDKVNIAAIADDGIIEAIEIKDKNFALGLQWHPEFFATESSDQEIIKNFIENCKGFRKKCGKA